MMAATMRTGFTIGCLCQICAAVIACLIRGHPDEPRTGACRTSSSWSFSILGKSQAARSPLARDRRGEEQVNIVVGQVLPLGLREHC